MRRKGAADEGKAAPRAQWARPCDLGCDANSPGPYGPFGKDRRKERARNKFPICGPVVSERSLGLTPEGSRSLARGILPLE